MKLKGKYLDVGKETSIEGGSWLQEGLINVGVKKGVFTEAEAEALRTTIRARQTTRLADPLNGERGKEAVTELFQSKGFDGIKYINEVEDVGSTSYMVFDPANIRSEFAHFDPLNVARPGLMGAATPGGVAAAGAGAAGLLSIIQSRRNR